MRIPLPVKGQSVDIVAGIDLGTTNTLVAQVVDGSPQIIPDREGRRITPSVVSIDDEHHPVVGDEARERALLNPSGTLWSVKRFLGRGLADLGEDLRGLPYRVEPSKHGEQVAFRVHGKQYLPQEVSAMILAEAKKRAERALGGRLRRAVITVPAYFDDSQRQATRDAGRIAGIDVLRIINEPTAAALAYGLDQGRTGTILVYDLGGGTFDVSVLKLNEGVFKVIATTGDTRLGGDDFDRQLMQLLLTDLEDDQRDQLLDHPGCSTALKVAAETAKKTLSEEENARIRLRFDQLGIEIDKTLSRADYEGIIEPLVERTLEAVNFVLDDADLDPEDVSEVVCVGGSTRTPLVRRRLEEHFGRAPHTKLDPDEVVALGAALQAHALCNASDGEDGTVLLDVTPLSLGIETYGGGVTKLLWRNTPIPVQATEGFTTQVDNQTGVEIHVLQGEREMARDLRSLGHFKLSGIPPMPAGMPRVLVEFFIDANGILKVTAKEVTSGVKAGIEVTPTYGLTDDRVEEMILDSIEHAEEDVEERMFADLKAEASGLLRYSRSALAQRQQSLDPALVTQVESAVAGMEVALDSGDKDSVEAAMTVLNESTHPIATQMMNEVLKVTVTGRTVTDILDEKQRRA